MNGQTENIISVTLVEPLLMAWGTVDYSKCRHVEHYLIRLGVEQIVTSIVTMVTGGQKHRKETIIELLIFSLIPDTSHELTCPLCKYS